MRKSNSLQGRISSNARNINKSGETASPTKSNMSSTNQASYNSAKKSISTGDTKNVSKYTKVEQTEESVVDYITTFLGSTVFILFCAFCMMWITLNHLSISDIDLRPTPSVSLSGVSLEGAFSEAKMSNAIQQVTFFIPIVFKLQAETIFLFFFLIINEK